MRRSRLRPPDRRGVAVVEAAFVLPVFLTVIFFLMAVGHFQLVDRVVKSACRMGARYGSTEGVSTDDVQTRVEEILATAIDPSAVTLLVKDASVFDSGGDLPQSQEDFEGLPNIALSEAEPRQLFVVRASLSYGDVAVLPLPFLTSATIVGQTFTRHE